MVTERVYLIFILIIFDLGIKVETSKCTDADQLLISPFSGMRRPQGREMGVIECWYTRADKLPKEEKTMNDIMHNKSAD